MAAAHQLAQAAQQTKADKVACHVHERLPKSSVTKRGVGRVPGLFISAVCQSCRRELEAAKARRKGTV